MKKGLLAAAMSVLALLGQAQTAGVDDHTVGLVLSGGGAKGIAHIGFIQALEENDIPIDCVAGTSMGAIVGSLYAIGKSPAEMMDLIKSDDFKLWSSGRIPPSRLYRFVMPGVTPQWVGVNVAIRDSSSITDILPTRLINPLPMSFAFMELYAPYTGESNCNFDSLMVPLRTVASDIYTHQPVVFSHGQLSEAVRASMSFPFVFQPIKVNGTLLYDGGLYDVYPVNVMEKDFNPWRMIGLNVSSPNTHPQLNNLIGQLENMIMTGGDTPFPEGRGVNVRFHLDRFGLLDWGAADQIYDIGYRRAIQMMDTIKREIPARRPLAEVEAARRKFAEGKKDVVFSSVEIDGTTPDKAEYIKYLLNGSRRGDRLMPIAQARDGFYRVASTGRLRNLVPHALYNDTTGLYRLRLDADVNKDFNLGVGGYLTSSNGSMLYATALYDPFSLRRPWASVEGWAGQNYLAAVGRIGLNLATAIPSHIDLRATVTREKGYETEKMFYDFTAPAFVTSSECSLALNYRMAAGNHGVAGANVAYGHTTDRFRSAIPTDPNLNGVSRIIQSLASAGVSWNYLTLNDPSLPTEGIYAEVSAKGYLGRRELRPWFTTTMSRHVGWGDFKAAGLGYIRAGRRFSIGVSGEAFYSTRSLMAYYDASIVNAAAFSPLPSSAYLFDPEFRANQYLAAGLHPVFSATSVIQLRLDSYLFAPMRRIKPLDDRGDVAYGKWFSGGSEFLGEFCVALKLPFGAVKGYVDYRSSEAGGWSGGISLGILVGAPKFME